MNLRLDDGPLDLLEEEAGSESPSLQRVRRLAETALAEAAAAREEVEAMPAGAGAMLAQCEESITRRATAILTGLDDETGTSGRKPQGEAPRATD